MTWFNPASTIVHGHVQHKLCKTPAPFVQAGKHSAILLCCFRNPWLTILEGNAIDLLNTNVGRSVRALHGSKTIVYIYPVSLARVCAVISSPLDQAITVACMYSQIVQCKESACALKTLKPWYHMNSIPWVCKPGVNTGNSIPCFESVFHSRIPRRLKERCITWHEKNSTPIIIWIQPGCGLF